MDDKYKYFYDNDFNYCYPNTNVLKNKLNITSDNDYNKLLNMFKNNAKKVSKGEQLKYIDVYIKDKNLATKL